jgi:hypothetical protein
MKGKIIVIEKDSLRTTQHSTNNGPTGSGVASLTRSPVSSSDFFIKARERVKNY